MQQGMDVGFLLIIILGIVIFVLAFLIVGIFIALVVTRKEKKEHIRVTAEAAKIDEMVVSGSITADEARELKQTLGPVAFTPTSRKPDIHIKIIGILNIVISCLGILLFGILLCYFGLGAISTRSETIPWIPIVCLPVFFLILFYLRIVASICLMKGAYWARIAIIVFAMLGIVSFPLGTALGIYTLWVLLLREDAGLYFISDTMKGNKSSALILFLTSIPLWTGLIYLTKVLPVKELEWKDLPVDLPAITSVVIKTGILCRQFGIIFFPLLFVFTLFSIAWFIIALIKDKHLIQT
jgi:uncharacterized protein YneF (UPF0154 family)